MPARARVAALLAALVTAPALVVGLAMPASAFGSAQSLAGPNAWIVTELATSGATGLVQTPSGTLDPTFDTSAITRDPRRAPTAVGKPAGWLSKAPRVGRVGAIVQTGATILDLAGFAFDGEGWLGGDTGPATPTGGGSEGGVSAIHPQYGTATVTPSAQRADGSFDVTVVHTPGPVRDGNIVDVQWGVKCSGSNGGPSGTLGSDNRYGRTDVQGPYGCAGTIETVTVNIRSRGTSDIYYGTGTGSASAGTRQTSQLTTTVQCRNATGEDFTVSESVDAYVGARETFYPADARCPDGSVAVSGTVTSTAPDGTVTTIVEPVTAPEWVGTLPVTAPGCTVAGAACALDLEVLLDGTTDQYVSCGINPSLCVNWQAKPVETPARYRCTYGGSDVGIGRCSSIEVDPSHPESPLRVPYPAARPVDAPAITPTRPTPEPGTGTTPSPGNQPENCRTTSVVFGGVKCALEEAFIPSGQGLANIQRVGSSLSTVTPLPQLGSIAGWLSPPAGGSRCWDLNIPIPDLGERSPLRSDVPVMNTCDASNPIVKAVTAVRPLIAVVVWVTFVAPLAWWAWRTYAPGSTGVA